MTAPPHPGWRRHPARTVLAIAVGALLLLAPTLAGSTDASASPGARTGSRVTASDSKQPYRARIHLRSMTPVAPGPKGEVTLQGTITNTGKEPLYDLTASFWIDESPLHTRSELAAAAAEDPGDRLGMRITEPYDLVNQVSDKLAPGASAKFRVRVPVQRLDLSGAGVYVVGVDVRYTPPNPNGVPPSQLRKTVARLRTFLPNVPARAKTTPVNAAFVVPLVARPNLVNGHTVLDGNARPFAPHGRLSQLLDLGARADVTWLVDPAVLAQAKAVAGGAHSVDGDPLPATTRKAARSWLREARQLLAADSTLLLPYADPDLNALEHHHLTRSWSAARKSAQRVARAVGLDWVRSPNRSKGGPTATPTPSTPTPSTPETTPTPTPTASDQPEPTGATESPASPSGTPTPEKSAGTTTPTPGASSTAGSPPHHPNGEPSGAPHPPGTGQVPDVVALPGQGYADAATLESAADSGLADVVLSADALPGLPKGKPTSLVSIATPAGPVTALVADASLTGRGTSGGGNKPASGPAVQQRFLSEAALLALNAKPGQSPRVVAMTPRNWTPGRSIESLFSTIDQVPWVQTISAKTLMNQPPTAYGGRLSYPNSVREDELDGALVDGLERLATRTRDFTSMLVKPRPARQRLAQAFLRGSSVSWRNAPGRGSNLVDTTLTSIEQTMNRVHVISPPFVTLSSHSGRFPVTIANDTSRPVKVALQVRPRVAGRLKIDPIEPVVVAPQRKATVTVSAHAPSGGVIQVGVGLATPTHLRFGATEQFTVRATEYGVFGWVIMGVGLGLLFLASGIRLVRRVRASRHGSREGGAANRPEPGAEGMPEP